MEKNVHSKRRACSKAWRTWLFLRTFGRKAMVGMKGSLVKSIEEGKRGHIHGFEGWL